MKKQAVFAILAIILGSMLLQTDLVFADTLVLEPVADAYVDSQNPAVNYGGAIVLESRFEPATARRFVPYLKFNLSSIPAGATINSANLHLYVRGALGSLPVSLPVFRPTEDWGENIITWDNKPSAPSPAASIEVTSAAGVYQSWDVAALVRDWVSGTYPNHGLFFFYEGMPVFHRIRFDSREAANRPRLIIDYTPPASPLAPAEEEAAPLAPLVDTRPPIISKLKIINITERTAVVIWTTDEKADSFVEYGLTDQFGLSVGKNDSATEHSIRLTGLKAGKLYYFRVRSKDGAGNEAMSKDFSFRTEKSPKEKAAAPKDAKTTIDQAKIAIVALSFFVFLLAIAVIVMAVLFRRKGKTPSS